MTNTSNANITKASKNAVFHEDLDNNHQSDEQLCFACNQPQSQVAQARSQVQSHLRAQTQLQTQSQTQSQMKSQTQTQAQSQTQPQQPSQSPKDAQPKLFTKAFICIALTNFAVFFNFQLTTVGMPVYLEQLGADELAVGLTVTLVTAAALLVRPFAGLILDSFGRKGALITGIILMLFVIVAYLLFPLVGVVLALRIFHGIGWGLSSTSTSTIVADVIPKVRFAEGMGWYALGGSLSAAIGPALSIFLLEEVGAQAMIFVASASLGIAFVLSLFVEDQAMPDKNNQAKHESVERSASSASRATRPSRSQSAARSSPTRSPCCCSRSSSGWPRAMSTKHSGGGSAPRYCSRSASSCSCSRCWRTGFSNIAATAYRSISSCWRWYSWEPISRTWPGWSRSSVHSSRGWPSTARSPAPRP